MHDSHMAPLDLAGLLAPFDSKLFLNTCWGQNFQHVPGQPGKFTRLLPWSKLNNILQEHRLDVPRIRLTREGKAVPAPSYVSYQTNRRRPGQSIPRLRAADLTNALRDGATLVLDAVDELHAPITDLAVALERVFRVKIQVNAYAGWRSSHGFDLHWDDHDVFILQIAGRKQWKVYGMTRKYPLGRDVTPTKDPPKDPLWEGMLNDGDLLYIPRGWWHVATPLNEPTLHLTVGVNNPTAADLLSWFAERLRASEHVRRDLPQFATGEEQSEFMNGLRDVIFKEWQPDLMQAFLADADAKSQPRARFHLPWSAMPEVLPPDDASFSVQWVTARPSEVDRNGSPNEIAVVGNGRRWRFAQAAAPILEALISGHPYTLEQLEEAVAGKLDAETVRAFIRELVAAGLVAVREHRYAL